MANAIATITAATGQPEQKLSKAEQYVNRQLNDASSGIGRAGQRLAEEMKSAMLKAPNKPFNWNVPFRSQKGDLTSFKRVLLQAAFKWAGLELQREGLPVPGELHVNGKPFMKGTELPKPTELDALEGPTTKAK